MRRNVLVSLFLLFLILPLSSSGAYYQYGWRYKAIILPQNFIDVYTIPINETVNGDNNIVSIRRNFTLPEEAQIIGITLRFSNLGEKPAQDFNLFLIKKQGSSDKFGVGMNFDIYPLGNGRYMASTYLMNSTLYHTALYVENWRKEKFLEGNIVISASLPEGSKTKIEDIKFYIYTQSRETDFVIKEIPNGYLLLPEPVTFKQLLLRIDASTPVTVYLKGEGGREHRVALNPNLSSMQTFYIGFDSSSKKITVSKIQNENRITLKEIKSDSSWLQVARIFVPSLNRIKTVAISGEIYISEDTKKGVSQDTKVIGIILVGSFLLIIWLKRMIKN